MLDLLNPNLAVPPEIRARGFACLAKLFRAYSVTCNVPARPFKLQRLVRISSGLARGLRPDACVCFPGLCLIIGWLTSGFRQLQLLWVYLDPLTPQIYMEPNKLICTGTSCARAPNGRMITLAWHSLCIHMPCHTLRPGG